MWGMFELFEGKEDLQVLCRCSENDIIKSHCVANWLAHLQLMFDLSQSNLTSILKM